MKPTKGYITVVYDNESGTVLAVEDCAVWTITVEEEELLSDGTLDMETWEGPERAAWVSALPEAVEALEHMSNLYHAEEIADSRVVPPHGCNCHAGIEQVRKALYRATNGFHKPTITTTFVIESSTEKDDEGYSLYWSNDHGWTLYADATLFSHDERRSFNLPMGGTWRKVVQS